MLFEMLRRSKNPMLIPDDGGGSGEAGDNGDTGENQDLGESEEFSSGANETPATLEEATQQLKFFRDGFEDLSRRNEELVRLVFSQQGNNNGNSGGNEYKVPEPQTPTLQTPNIDLSEIDESLRPAIKLIMEKVLPEYAKPLVEEIKGLRTELTQTKTNTAVSEADRQIKEVAGRHQDFWNFKSQMHKLASQHPSLGAEDLYQLAKAKVVGFNRQQASNKPKPATSEKPSTGGGNVQVGQAKTMQEALERSWQANASLRERLTKDFS